MILPIESSVSLNSLSKRIFKLEKLVAGAKIKMGKNPAGTLKNIEEFLSRSLHKITQTGVPDEELMDLEQALSSIEHQFVMIAKSSEEISIKEEELRQAQQEFRKRVYDLPNMWYR